MELSSQADLYFRCKSWLPKRTFILAARVQIPSVPSFSLQPSCLPLIIPLRTWWRIFVAHKWPFSRLSWGVDFTACKLLFRHLIQGSKRNEQDNCSTTASLTCTLKHHSLAGCRHHQMLVPVQNAADCTDFWTRWPTLTAWCLMPCTRRVILLWSETSVNCWGNFLKLHVPVRVWFFVGCAGFPTVFIVR